MTFNVYSWFLCIMLDGGGGGGLSPTISLRLGGWESGKFMSVFVNFQVFCCLRKDPIYIY